jgi:putative ABC transport system permease protein
MPQYARLAIRNLIRRRGRALLAVAAISLITAVYFTLASVAAGLRNAIGEAGSARSLILLDARSVWPDDGSIGREVVDRVARTRDVADVVPMLYRISRVSGSNVHIRGVPGDSYRDALRPSDVRGRELGGTNGVLIGEGLVELHGWRIGDELTVAEQRLNVLGVFRGEGPKNYEIWARLDDARRLLGRTDAYSQVLVLVAERADPHTVRAALTTQLSPFDISVYFEDDYYRESNRALSQLESVAAMVSAIALVAIVSGTFNAVSMTATEHRRDVAILKVVGMARRWTLGVFLAEGLALVSGGLLLGLGAGALTVHRLASSSFLNFADVAVRPVLTGDVVVLGSALALCLGLLGAYLPARRAAAISVAEVLRG